MVSPGKADRGIIPAHAGCTFRTDQLWSGDGDHPRSRGVHVVVDDDNHWCGGSSPLTRGAQGGVGVHRSTAGIIPAHAGCTVPGLRSRCPPPDHPRSRGVHPNRETWAGSSWGSSPLTRGAQGAGPKAGHSSGIIPAHAGCTAGPPGRPRRGAGSSPLTRGAPAPWRPRQRRRGIIPAHAGCTRSRRTSRTGGPDHPRSRGVHPETSRGFEVVDGSSPLTRGAHVDGGGVPAQDGIIPAHAGCTRSRPPGRRP